MFKLKYNTFKYFNIIQHLKNEEADGIHHFRMIRFYVQSSFEILSLKLLNFINKALNVFKMSISTFLMWGFVERVKCIEPCNFKKSLSAWNSIVLSCKTLKHNTNVYLSFVLKHEIGVVIMC